MANLVDKRCDSIEWHTPDRVLDPVKAYFGGSIHLDPATAQANPTGARKFYTKSDNGLLHPWADRTFLNPPYGAEMKDWLYKLANEARRGAEIIALLPASRWEQYYFQAHAFNENLSGFVLIRKRVRFINGNTGEVCPSNPYASILFGYNIATWTAFREAMHTIGTVVRVDELNIYDEGANKIWKRLQ